MAVPPQSTLLVQFGHVYPIRAWHKVQLDWGLTVNNVFALGHVRRVIYPDFGPDSDKLVVSARLETMELTDYIAGNMLLSVRRFARKGPKEKLVDLEACVNEAMEELYSPEKIFERLKVINSKLEVVDLDIMQGFIWFSKDLQSKGE